MIEPFWKNSSYVSGLSVRIFVALWLQLWFCGFVCSDTGIPSSKHRIYSINRLGRLLNFWTLRVGAYSRWALIRGWALIKFSPFSTSVVCIFCNKTVNGNNKTRRCNKATFLQNTLKKTPSSGKSLVSTYSFLRGVGAYLSLSESGREVGWRWALIKFFGLQDGRLFEVGANSRLGAYSNKYGNNVCHYWRCDGSSVQFWVYQCGWGGGGCDVIFNITEGGLELFFFVLEGGTV